MKIKLSSKLTCWVLFCLISGLFRVFGNRGNFQKFLDFRVWPYGQMGSGHTWELNLVSYKFREMRKKVVQQGSTNGIAIFSCALALAGFTLPIYYMSQNDIAVSRETTDPRRLFFIDNDSRDSRHHRSMTNHLDECILWDMCMCVYVYICMILCMCVCREVSLILTSHDTNVCLRSYVYVCFIRSYGKTYISVYCGGCLCPRWSHVEVHKLLIH